MYKKYMFWFGELFLNCSERVYKVYKVADCASRHVIEVGDRIS